MSGSTLEASEDTKGVKLKNSKFGYIYIVTCLLYLLCNMGPFKGTVHQPNKLLSYAQFCLH